MFVSTNRKLFTIIFLSIELDCLFSTDRIKNLTKYETAEESMFISRMSLIWLSHDSSWHVWKLIPLLASNWSGSIADRLLSTPNSR